MLTAKDARDVGMASVAQNNKQWMLHGQVILITRFPVGTYHIFEQFRMHLIKRQGFYEPTTHKAWGALSRTAQLRGILRKTGQREHMLTVKSHARESDVLVRVDAWMMNVKFRKLMEELLPHFHTGGVPTIYTKTPPEE